MKGKLVCFWAVPLCLMLSGCTLAHFWLSGCGGSDPDLVVVNDSKMAVGSVTLGYGNQTEVVSNADGSTLLERGDYYGFELEKGAEQVIVTLTSLDQRELARCLVSFEGERLYVTLREDGTLSVSEEEPADG